MATTPNFAIPYPLPSAPVANGAADMQAIAERLDALLAEFAYTQITAPVPVTATTEATANTIVTAPAITVSGAILVEFFAPAAYPAPDQAGRQLNIILFEDGTSLGRIAHLISPAAGYTVAPIAARRRFAPAAGSRVYSVRAYGNATGGQVNAGAGGAGLDVPSYLRITRA